MSIRRDPIYISSEVWRWLRLLSKAESPVTEGGSRSPISTPDEIADHILRQAIREQHPQLPEHQKKLDNLEKETIETLRTKNENKTVSGTRGTGVES